MKNFYFFATWKKKLMANFFRYKEATTLLNKWSKLKWNKIYYWQHGNVSKLYLDYTYLALAIVTNSMTQLLLL